MTAKPYKLQSKVWKFWITFYRCRSIEGAEAAASRHEVDALPGDYRLVFNGRTLMTWWK